MAWALLIITMMRVRSRPPEAATTLVEVLVAAVVVTIFFASIFQVSAVCLRYISSSKENISAIECVHDQLEQFRSLAFADLVDPTFQAVAPTPPPAHRRRRHRNTATPQLNDSIQRL